MATRSVVPRADNEGGIGTALKRWAAGFFNTLSCAIQTVSNSINLTGGQIVFPAGQVASAGANTLDDYEEGVWTPDLKFGNAKVGITYNATYLGGWYTKVGRLVVATGILYLTSKGTSVGSAVISGLPFAANAAAGAYSPVTLSFNGITFANQVHSLLGAGLQSLPLYETSTAGVRSDLTDSDFANNSSLEFSVSYFV